MRPTVPVEPRPARPCHDPPPYPRPAARTATGPPSRDPPPEPQLAARAATHHPCRPTAERLGRVRGEYSHELSPISYTASGHHARVTLRALRRRRSGQRRDRQGPDRPGRTGTG